MQKFTLSPNLLFFLYIDFLSRPLDCDRGLLWLRFGFLFTDNFVTSSVNSSTRVSNRLCSSLNSSIRLTVGSFTLDIVKVTYLGIRSAHERVWLVEWKPIWLPRAYLTRGDLEPARGNLHVCKLLRDLTIIQILTVTAEWAGFVLSAFARRTCYIARKEGRKEGRREPEGEREGEREREREEREREREREREKEGTATEREGERVKLTTVSSLELIQESVSCCLLRPLLTTDIVVICVASSLVTPLLLG